MTITKVFCDICKKNEIKGAAAGSLTFSYVTGGLMDLATIKDKHLLLCEECNDKVAEKIMELGLTEDDSDEQRHG